MTNRTATATSSTNEVPAAQMLASAAVLGVLLYLLVAWPVLVWSTIHGEPKLMGFGTAVGGGIRWLSSGVASSTSRWFKSVTGHADRSHGTLIRRRRTVPRMLLPLRARADRREASVSRTDGTFA